MSYRRRIGQFLAILGCFSVALYIFSDISKLPEYGLLGAGVVLLVMGILLVIGNPKPPPEPNPRFRMLKKMREKKPKGPKPQKVEKDEQAHQAEEKEREKPAREKGRSR